MPNPNQLNTFSESSKHEMPVFSYPNSETISDNPDKKVERKQSSQMTDLESFEDFVNSNNDKLRGLNSKKDTKDYFYYRFCENKQPDEKLLDNSWFSSEIFEAQYDIVEKLADYNVRQPESDYWQVVQVGEVDRSKLGRVYLNPKNENLPSTYREIALKLAKNGADFQMKTFKNIDSKNYNRSDKMVVYFNAENADTVMDCLTGFVEDYPGKMNSNTPRFTKKLTNAEGEILPGIAFAENPASRKGSFNMQMSEILAESYLRSNEGGQIDINSDKFFENFSGLCIEKGVDLSHLYKNKDSNFPNI